MMEQQRKISIIRAAAAAILAATVMILAACGAGGSASSESPSVRQQARQNEAATEKGNTANINPVDNGGGIGTTGSTNSGSAPRQGMKGNGSSIGTEADSEAIKLRKQYVVRIYKLAKQGKMANAGDFIVGKTLIDDVHKAWGEPNRSEGGYDFYSPGMMKGTIAFGIGRGDVVKEIRIFGTALDPIKDGVKLKVSDVKNAIGKPSTVRTTGNQKILVYKLGSYELKFVYTPDGAKDVELDHINVVSPKAAKPMGAD